jgi:hypothetical protein
MQTKTLKQKKMENLLKFRTSALMQPRPDPSLRITCKTWKKFLITAYSCNVHSKMSENSWTPCLQLPSNYFLCFCTMNTLHPLLGPQIFITALANKQFSLTHSSLHCTIHPLYIMLPSQQDKYFCPYYFILTYHSVSLPYKWKEMECLSYRSASSYMWGSLLVRVLLL